MKHIENLTLNIQLDRAQFNILKNIEEHTGYPVDSLISELVAGKSSWAELQDLNEIHQLRVNHKKGNWFSNEEVKKSLQTGIIPR